jgi:hypothetical protein
LLCGLCAFEVGFATVPTLLMGGNANPLLQGLEVDGVRVESAPCGAPEDCPATGDENLPQTCHQDAGATGHCLPLLERCERGDASCPEYRLTPLVAAQSAEPNPLAAAPGKPVPREVLTVHLYAPWLDSSLDFVWEADGWSEPLDYRMRVPAAYPREGFRLWVLLRDNRGGVDWLYRDFALPAAQ